MDELKKVLESLPLRRTPASLDERIRCLLERDRQDAPLIIRFPRRRMFFALVSAACVAMGFAAGLFYAHWHGGRRPEVVYVYPMETVNASHLLDFTQGSASQLPPWNSPVRVDIRSTPAPNAT